MVCTRQSFKFQEVSEYLLYRSPDIQFRSNLDEHTEASNVKLHVPGNVYFIFYHM